MDTFPHDLLRYEPETGRMFWRKNRYKHLIGKEAGGIDNLGRWKIGLTIKPHKIKFYRRSRLAFLWKHGRWPHPTVDHINRNRLDDRIHNLREASYKDQQQNTASWLNDWLAFRSPSGKNSNPLPSECIEAK